MFSLRALEKVYPLKVDKFQSESKQKFCRLQTKEMLTIGALQHCKEYVYLVADFRTSFCGFLQSLFFIPASLR